MFFKYFWDLDFFVKTSPLLPLRLHQKIDFCAKCHECCGKKLSSPSNINKSKTEKDWRIKTSFRAKSIFWWSLRGSRGDFLTKKSRSQKYLKNIWIYSVFAANSEYDTSFELKCSLSVENVRIPTPKSVKTVPGNNMLRYVPSEQYFLSLKNMKFCSYWKGLSNGKNPNSIDCCLGGLLSKHWYHHLPYFHKVDPGYWPHYFQRGDHFKITYTTQFCALNTNLKSVFLIFEVFIYSQMSDQQSLGRIAYIVVHAKSTPQFFPLDNLMSKDVPSWYLCLVKKEL